MRRRLVPDAVQVQIILGSLLGGARIEGQAGERRMRVVDDVSRSDYVWWKYERLAEIAAHPPAASGSVVSFATIAHPLFDDLAPLFVDRAGVRDVVRQHLAPLGLAVWMSDRGRVRLCADLFVPTRHDLALTA